jgi:Glycosyltransferase
LIKNIKTIYNPVEKQNQIIKRSNEFIKKFIYVGRIQLNDQKNLSEMLLGLSHLKLKWKLDIYGDGEIDKVSDLAYKLNILDNIQFHGWVMNPWIKMKNVDALLLTSTYEGFGMVLAEAISRGIPCISSDCPVGPSDIILNGVNGYLYKMGDIDDFINNVYSVVSNEQFNDTTQIIESLKNYYSPKYDENFLNSIASFK